MFSFFFSNARDIRAHAERRDRAARGRPRHLQAHWGGPRRSDARFGLAYIVASCASADRRDLPAAIRGHWLLLRADGAVHGPLSRLWSCRVRMSSSSPRVPKTASHGAQDDALERRSGAAQVGSSAPNQRSQGAVAPCYVEVETDRHHGQQRTGSDSLLPIVPPCVGGPECERGGSRVYGLGQDQLRGVGGPSAPDPLFPAACLRARAAVAARSAAAKSEAR